MNMVSMSSVIHRYSPSSFTSLNSHLKHKQKLETNTIRTLYLSGKETTRRLLRSRKIDSLRTGAVADPAAMILGVSSPAKSGDLSVLLITRMIDLSYPLIAFSKLLTRYCSAVFLTMYWIANFVVPNLVSKSLQFDEFEKEGKTVDKE